jgi:hypothetical protein
MSSFSVISMPTREAAGSLDLHLAIAVGIEEQFVRVEAAQMPDGAVINRGRHLALLVLRWTPR